MPIPEQYRKQLEQQRQQAEVRSQLSKQYDKEMAARFTKDMPSFSEWLAQRQQSKAGGGKVFKKETRERNLKKFLDESKEKRRLYHGTQKDFGEFNSKYHGVFLTPDPEFSEDFSLPFNRDKTGGNTMPVHVQVKDPFDYENPEHRARLRKAAQEVHGSDKMHKYIEDLNGRWNKNNWEHIEAASMMEPIKHAGFDSYYVSESARKNLAVFDPKKIKSAIGNRGTYNTNVADINKAQGGLAHMAGGGTTPNILRGNILAGASWNSINPTLANVLTQYNGMPTTNTAIGGATTYDTLKQLNDFLGEGGSFEPGANVFLQTGGLDLMYGDKRENIQNNIDQILTKLENQGVNVVLTGSPYASSMEDVTSNNFNPELDEIYTNIAASHPNVSMVKSMGNILQDKSLLSDNLHPNEKGWDVYNQSVLEAAKRFQNNQNTQSNQTASVAQQPNYFDQQASQAEETPTQNLGGLPVNNTASQYTPDTTASVPAMTLSNAQVSQPVVERVSQPVVAKEEVVVKEPEEKQKAFERQFFEEIEPPSGKSHRDLGVSTMEMAKGGTVKEPKSTVKAYKLFRVHPDHPGKLFPLFVDANTPVEMNKWVDAKEGEMKGNKVKSKIGDLAYRPGWHAGDLPIATHIGEKSDPKLTAPDRRPANHAWAEVEMPNDVDWQSEANKRGTNAQGKVIPVKAHITDQIPKGGHYRYKTNPNMTGNWLIGGSMKVNKVLSDAEVARINKAAGMSDLPRAQPFKKKEFGFAKGGCVGPEEWMAEEHVNHAKGGEITNPFDYENPDHVETVANIAAKHKDFSKITDVAKHLATTLATGNWRHIEDPRIQDAIKQAGHDGYHVAEKHGKDQHVMKKAQGGNVNPSLAQMKMALAQKSSSVDLKNIGVNEAPNMSPKHFFPPETSDIGLPSPGGVATPRGMPIGGIDMSRQQGGQQLMPSMPQAPQAAPGQPPAPGAPAPGAGAPPGAPAGPTPPAGNMLSMTPQGQTMAALGGGQKMAKGGSAKSVDDMKAELATKASPQDKRVTIKAEGSGGVKGIVVPRHTLEGNAKVGAVGLHEMNEARAKVYGGEHREPLTLNKIAAAHRDTLKDHFSKSIEEQHEAEAAALKRLRDAKHLGANANTLDESEKLDTVRHEHDEEGRTHIGFASKGVAGHALYTSGSGKDTKYHVINTCPGQTEGCGGGKDAEGIVDTKKGTCFAPNAESQYAGAATRRAAHEQAKHDPKMTHDWILAHTGSLRNAARLADKNNQRLLFRPNVVDETDVSSRHAIRHLNEQRKAEGKPPIIANSYGKTNELHDPENGYYVTHSNVGPKVKKGQEIAENIGRDKARVRNTIMAADNKGDFTNEQGNKTPPKGSYMVTDVKRGSPMAKNMEKHITHAKYWTTGREEHELTPEEKAEGPEGHFSGSGRKTSEDKAHYGHKTVEGKRFDYQRQHILHPRLVQVGENKDGTPHMIPTDSRFKDTEFLPKNRFKTKNGKDAGHILMTTPTESTSNIGHQTSFTHHVNDKHIEHAMKNNGEYEIDKPEDQIKAAGKEYRAPQAIKFYAEGGGVGGVRHRGFSHDDFHAFPEQNVVAQRHMAMRHGEDEHKHVPNKKAVVVHKNAGTMRYEMSMNKKAK